MNIFIFKQIFFFFFFKKTPISLIRLSLIINTHYKNFIQPFTHHNVYGLLFFFRYFITVNYKPHLQLVGREI